MSWHPADAGEVTGPGVAMTTRRCLPAVAAVLREPDRSPASTTSVAPVIVAMIIATMTGATLVVEAGLRSGSRNTAATAGKHLRVVMATPGPVTSPASAGCHDMIREQLAVLVTDLDEVMELIGRVGGDAAPGRPRPRRPGDDLEPDDRRVHDGLGLRARSVEEVAAIAGVSLGQVQALSLIHI